MPNSMLDVGEALLSRLWFEFLTKDMGCLFENEPVKWQVVCVLPSFHFTSTESILIHLHRFIAA